MASLQVRGRLISYRFLAIRCMFVRKQSPTPRVWRLSCRADIFSLLAMACSMRSAGPL
jgi:hypothetical protein